MGLKYVIGLDNELELVGELSSGHGAVEFVKRLKPDVLLLDIYMPGRDGLQVLEDIRFGIPTQKVIMLTTSAADNDVYRAMSLGANGYLMKDRDADDIYRAIKTVAEGGKFVPAAVKELLTERQHTPELTYREQGVLNMMAEGNSNEKIATAMGMSRNGVKQHVSHIFAKLGVKDRVSAVTEALKRGFVKMNFLGMLLALAAAAAAMGLAPRALAADEPSITAFGALETTANSREQAGCPCRLFGTVVHVSTVHPRMFLLARADRPHTAGAVVFLAGEAPMPQVGDEIWIDGRTITTPWKLGVRADSFVLSSRREIDFEYQLRNVELRKNLLNFRRVAVQGRVANVNHEVSAEGGDITILSVSLGRKTVPVHVPGVLPARRYNGREIIAHGFVFPLCDEHGKVLGHAVETTGESAVSFVRADYAPYVVWILVPLLSIAFAVVFVAWVRSRRQRIRMAVVAEERRRMAQDLHDTIEQHLACVRLLMAGLLNMKGLDDKVRETLMHGCDVLANAKAEVREAVLNLRGDGITELSPADALREIARGIAKGGAIRIRTRLAALPEALAQGQMQDLILIVREAITNAIKHGHAKTIVLLADKGEERVELRILNDGEPFDAASALGPETGHFGLSGMRERAARSGFGLEFSNRGRWSFVSVTIKPATAIRG